MRYDELKKEIRDLGFEEDQIFTEYGSIFANAITRACKVIATTVKAPIGRLDLDLTNNLGTTESEIEEGSTVNPIVINGEDVTASRFDIVKKVDTVNRLGALTSVESTYYFDGFAWQVMGRFDLDFLTQNEDGVSRFDSIERIVYDYPSGTKTFLQYDLEEDHILVLDSSLEQDLILFYKERIIPVTESTADDYKIQVAYPCEPLVALLAAHYVWLDDDERKAVMYWNEYDQLKQEIEAKAFKLKARIVGGI